MIECTVSALIQGSYHSQLSDPPLFLPLIVEKSNLDLYIFRVPKFFYSNYHSYHQIFYSLFKKTIIIQQDFLLSNFEYVLLHLLIFLISNHVHLIYLNAHLKNN
jgi:hypothetical protein